MRERARSIDVADGPIDDGERAQPQEIEFHQPGCFDVVLVELRHRRRTALFAVQRGEIGQHRRCDDHAARVRAGIAREALEGSREIDEFAHVGVAFVQAPEFLLLLERLVERDADLERNQFRDLVHVAVVVSEHAADVAYHCFRRQRSVGDDLRHAVAAVLVGDVFDDPVAAFHAEVDVEIRHRHALGIQEALEQQVMLDRIQIGNAQHVGDQRTCAGAAAGPDGNAVVARPADEIGHDQKIPGKSHRANDAELQIQPSLVGRAARLVRGAAIGPRSGLGPRCLRAQEVFDAAAGGHRVGRQHRGSQANFKRASLGNFYRIIKQFRCIIKQLRHLGRRLQVLLFRIAPRPARVGEQGAVVDADACFVRVEFGARQKAYIVGGERRHASLLTQFQHGRGVALLIRAAGALHFEVKPIAAQVLPAGEAAQRLIIAPARERLPDVPVRRARQNDQPLQHVALQPAAFQHRRAAALTFQKGTGHELRQMPIAREVLAEKDDSGRSALVCPADPRVDSDQRLDARGQCFLIEFHHRK